MTQYYNVAHGTKALDSGFAWPYDIDLCFENVEHPVAFSEGVGHGSAGCAVSAPDALKPIWREHFHLTNGGWLLPFIEQLATERRISKDAVLREYLRINGKPAECYESKFS